MFDRLKNLLTALWRRQNIRYAAAGAGALGAWGVVRNFPLVMGMFRNLFAAGEAAFEAVITAMTSPTLRPTLVQARDEIVAEIRDQWSRLQGAVTLVILVTVLSAMTFPVFVNIPYGWAIIWGATGIHLLLVTWALAARAGFVGAVLVAAHVPLTPSQLRGAVAKVGTWVIQVVAAMLAIQLGLVMGMLVIPWQAAPFVLAGAFTSAYFLLASLAVSRAFAAGQTSGRKLATAGMVVGLLVMGGTAGAAFLLSGFDALNAGSATTVAPSPATGTTPAPARFSPGQIERQFRYAAAKRAWDWVYGNPSVPDTLTAAVPRGMAGQSMLPSISTPPTGQEWAHVGSWQVSARDHQPAELARDLEPGWYVLVATGEVTTRPKQKRHEPAVVAEAPGSDYHELAHFAGMQAAYGQAMIRLTSAMEERWLYVNPQARSGLYWTAFPNRAKTWETSIYISNYSRVGVLVMDDDHRGYVGDPRIDNSGKFELALYRVATPGAQEARVEDLRKPTRKQQSLPWDLHRPVEADTSAHASLPREDRPAE